MCACNSEICIINTSSSSKMTQYHCNRWCSLVLHEANSSEWRARETAKKTKRDILNRLIEKLHMKKHRNDSLVRAFQNAKIVNRKIEFAFCVNRSRYDRPSINFMTKTATAIFKSNQLKAMNWKMFVRDLATAIKAKIFILLIRFRQ